tara:strand:- start:156 stop:335 length:180 start_codon:yes stop_codon:yes gene_type:complete
MKLFNIYYKILTANKACIKGTCEGILKKAAIPSLKAWSISKTVQLKNRLCEQDIIILQS